MTPVPDPSAGPVPRVQVSLGFDDAPLEGLVHLTPVEGSDNWHYSLDVDEDGEPDHEGILGPGIGFGYRFEESGVHTITVDFEGSDGIVTIHTPVIVNDPSAIQLLDSAQVPPADPNAYSFEGIAIDHAGERLYIANYSDGSLVQLDASDLSILERIDTMGYSIEGLSISPSNELLFAVYKYGHIAAVRIPELEIRTFHQQSTGTFYVDALDERRILVGGEVAFRLFDVESGTILAQAETQSGDPLYSGHFVVSPDRSLAAVVSQVQDRYNWIHLVDIPSLSTLREIELPMLSRAYLVAFDPREPKLYVLGYDEETAHFIVLDRISGEIVRDLPLGPAYCGAYCVANPVATSMSRRYVAMEWSGGAYIIDTDLDLPLYRFGLYGSSNYGFSVTASPAHDVFFFLRSGGNVQKIVIEPIDPSQ